MNPNVITLKQNAGDTIIQLRKATYNLSNISFEEISTTYIKNNEGEVIPALQAMSEVVMILSQLGLAILDYKK